MADHGAGASHEMARHSPEQGQGHDPTSEPPPPPPPAISSQGIITKDITDRFATAVKTLSPGELVKDGFFSLFEAVAALQIMEPKMDSGMVKPGEEFDELYDVSRPLAPAEVLGIIDELICHEMSWHLGYPLSQTLLTSVYIEALSASDPKSTQEAKFVKGVDSDANQQPMLQVLRAYCLGLLKTCDLVNAAIKSEHYYEEEDFVTVTYNRSLLAKIPTDDISEVLEQALHLLSSQRDTDGAELTDALISRLELRRILLSAVQCSAHIKDAAKAREPWTKAIAILPNIESSHCLGQPVDEAFSEKLQRKLASTIPPRPILKLEFSAAFGHLTHLVEDGSDMINVLEYTNSQCLMTYFSTFQAKKPQALVYIRAQLQTFLFNAMDIIDGMSIRELIDDDLSIVSLPASPLLDRNNDQIEAVHDVRHVMAQYMEMFRSRASQPFLEVLRTACQNRCRVRRTLCHMIREWESLEFEAEDVDAVLAHRMRAQSFMSRATMRGEQTASQSPSLASWCQFYKLRQMELILHLGFELEIVQPDELAGMYWYLDHLSGLRLRHLERHNAIIMGQVEARRSQSNLQPQVQHQLQQTINYTRLSLHDAGVTHDFSTALSCLYTVLERLGLVKAPAQPYNDEEPRYALRMKPFANIISPPVPSFDEFKIKVLQAERSTEELLSHAEKATAGAKKSLEVLSKLSAQESFSVGCHGRWLAAVKRTLKSSIAAGLAITSLRLALESASGGQVKVKAEVPRVADGYHEWWMVPKIVALE
ncbi:hypothetical protein CDD81_3242 [Ophiocordyceps australis]|uniref:Uncharacterized protein n=1 Tax=Ophiocordyceps australis TaxID=1399860 RepID=A0A2C5YE09_9HYPO|nr:hypothetical protein CDD81_3242 [Ophiocordyceps australis]